MQYAYDATVSSNVFSRQHRAESVTYPDGRVIFFDYDTANADYPSNRLSWVRKLREINGSLPNANSHKAWFKNWGQVRIVSPQ
ncbi:unnamed protein product [marine sediment metagenome]|uniref:Uncharacterized protein n=1 Tax=marine sediment metagenome TaxID=412755 RepID=X0W9C2_9ZZZZ